METFPERGCLVYDMFLSRMLQLKKYSSKLKQTRLLCKLFQVTYVMAS